MAGKNTAWIRLARQLFRSPNANMQFWWVLCWVSDLPPTLRRVQKLINIRVFTLVHRIIYTYLPAVLYQNMRHVPLSFGTLYFDHPVCICQVILGQVTHESTKKVTIFCCNLCVMCHFFLEFGTKKSASFSKRKAFWCMWNVLVLAPKNQPFVLVSSLAATKLRPS